MKPKKRHWSYSISESHSFHRILFIFVETSICTANISTKMKKWRNWFLLSTKNINLTIEFSNWIRQSKIANFSLKVTSTLSIWEIRFIRNHVISKNNIMKYMILRKYWTSLNLKIIWMPKAKIGNIRLQISQKNW